MSGEEKKPEEAGQAEAGEGEAKAAEPTAAVVRSSETAEAPAVEASEAAPAQAEPAADAGVSAPAAGETQAAAPNAAAAPDAGAAGDTAPVDPEREAKLRAAAEARAARAAAKAAAEGGAPPAGEAAPAGTGDKPARVPRGAAAAEDAGPKEPSPNQPLLDRVVAILKETLGEDVVEQAYINEMDGHRPYVVIKNERWPEAATVFRDHTELKCDYLRNLSGVDQETHLEVVYHLLSLTSKREYGVKVKTDRETPAVPSVTPVWDTANWNEREVYDLFGVDFPGHPDLRRIMMPDDWVGYPLRKDYEPLDPEV